jgi:hypothetical protein
MNKVTVAIQHKQTTLKRVGGVWVIPPAAVNPKERLAAWERVRGMWKNRKPDPIKELKKMRRGWERKLPSLRGKRTSR